MAVVGVPYDARWGRKITQADLPDDISPALLFAFCRAAGASFHSRETFTSFEAPVWEVQPDWFRAATFDHPARGVNVNFSAVREWRRKIEAANVVEARKLCTELPLIEARLRACGLWTTARSVGEAVKRIGYETAELESAKGLVS